MRLRSVSVCLPLGVALLLAGTSFRALRAQDFPALSAPRKSERVAELTLPAPDSEKSIRLGGAKPSGKPEGASESPVARRAEVRLAPDAKVEMIHERYANGSIKISREISQDEEGNFINHGSWKMLDERGRLKMEGSYHLDKPHGDWVQMYYEDLPQFMQQANYRQFATPVTSRVTFENGQLQGVWTVTDGKQLKVSEVRFADGQREGKAVWYATTARPRREVNYRQGLVHGELIDYGPNGDVASREQYQEGRRLAPKTTYHKGEQKKTTGMYLFARLVVQNPDDWWKGAMATYTTEGKDERHGAWSSWHVNGTLEQKGEFEHDVPVGKIAFWYPNGQQALTGEYLEGKQHGEWTWWHENGIKSVIGQYEEGVPVGQWVWWKTDGKVAQKIDYADGAGGIVTLKPQDDGTTPAAPTPAGKGSTTDTGGSVPSAVRTSQRR